MAPAMGWRADEARHRHDAVLQLADEMREASGIDQSFGRLPTGNLGNFLGNKKRIGARRLVAGGAPTGVGFDRLAPQELNGFGAWFVPQRLALQMAGQRKDFHAALLGLGHPFGGVGLGPGVVAAALQVEFPGGFFPAVESGLGDPVEPGVFRDVAKLAAHQSNLMV